MMSLSDPSVSNREVRFNLPPFHQRGFAPHTFPEASLQNLCKIPANPDPVRNYMASLERNPLGLVLPHFSVPTREDVVGVG